MNQLFWERASRINEPNAIGSYSQDDCVFVLNELASGVEEEENEIRERKMAEGVHYSEMLPIEHLPSVAYLNIYRKTLKENAFETAQYVANVSEMVLDERGSDVVLVSLARAGTPVGVLMKRYMSFEHGINVPHYSISIIRGKGIDENALIYILGKHPLSSIVFVDGWTGKGAIGKVLHEAVADFNVKYDAEVSPELAVLADPAYSAEIYGTREDFFLPSSCLNSIVSGLVSRTVHRNDLTEDNGFHFAKYYKEWTDVDLSNDFVNAVTKEFPHVEMECIEKEPCTYKGWVEIEQIQRDFNIEDVNKVKPSIGETTRVLLRRVTWKILVQNLTDPTLEHIRILAKEKGIPIEEYKNMNYKCIGLIREEF